MTSICLRDRPDPLPTAENVLDEYERTESINMFNIMGVQIIHGGRGVQAKDLFNDKT